MYPQPAQPTTVLIRPSSRVNESALKRIGILQIVIGMVSIGIGIALSTLGSSYWLVNIRGGIWIGVWIIIAGIFCLSTSSNSSNSCLLGTSLFFNIVAIIAAIVDGILFGVAAVHLLTCRRYSYNYYYDYSYSYGYVVRDCSNNTGGALYSVLLGMMALEFGVALAACVYCCSGCCGHQSHGVIIQQQQQPPYMISTSTAGHTVSNPYPYNTAYQTSAPQYTTPGYTGAAFVTHGGNSNVAYSNEATKLLGGNATAPALDGEAPPPYRP